MTPRLAQMMHHEGHEGHKDHEAFIDNLFHRHDRALAVAMVARCSSGLLSRIAIASSFFVGFVTSVILVMSDPEWAARPRKRAAGRCMISRRVL